MQMCVKLSTYGAVKNESLFIESHLPRPKNIEGAMHEPQQQIVIPSVPEDTKQGCYQIYRRRSNDDQRLAGQF
jgi:hypothetical protein